MTVELRAVCQADVPALLAIPGAPPSAEDLRGQLFDAARDRGRRVVVAARGGAVAGCAGWVEAPPWCYGAPVLAADGEVAAALVAHVVARARGFAERIRISAAADEPAKHAALRGAGFAPVFDFVTYARRVGPGDGAVAALPWRRIGWADLDVERLRDVENDTFAGVPNAPPMSADELAEALASPRCDRDATAAWADDAGAYVAFAQLSRDADERGRFASVDAVGVRAALRGRGVAAALIDDVIARVAGEVAEVRALIASTNAASIALHAGRGFAERARRTVYEAALTR